jgi:hypothetical protein
VNQENITSLFERNPNTIPLEKALSVNLRASFWHLEINTD